MDFHKPGLLLASIEEEIEGIPAEEFLNKSKYEKQRESWCAALFGVGLEKLGIASLVRVNETNHRLDIDFEVDVAGSILEFQLVMAKDPELPIGRLYKELASGDRNTFPYRPAKGSAEGPAWIRAAIEKKIAKNYARPEALNLLVYINFDAHEIKYTSVYDECADALDHFASVWLLSGGQLGSLKEGDVLPPVHGWIRVRNVAEYYV